MIVTIGGIPVYEALVTDEGTGMFRISLVDDPAVMSDFQAFDAERRPVMYSVADEEHRLVRGVVMRADFPIYRKDPGMGEYYIIYKADQIRRMAERYLVESRQNNVNLMHEEGSDVTGVHLVQWFIKGDGVTVDGFGDIADGSLLAEFHVTNDTVWAEIKAGTYKGFSLEGVFDLVPERDKDEVQEIVDTLGGAFKRLLKPNNMSKLSRFKAALARILAEFGSVTTDRGVLVWDGEDDLKAGDEVFIEEADGTRTAAAEGEYVTTDNKTIVVVDGRVSEIRDPEAEVAPETGDEPVEAGSVETDKGVLAWEGEEDLREGVEVFVIRDGEAVPAEDGEYVTADNKTIVVTDGKVAEIRDPEAEIAPEDDRDEEIERLRKENADLKAQVRTLTEKVVALSKMSAAKPAHEEVKETAATFQKTGIKGLDNLQRILSAK